MYLMVEAIISMIKIPKNQGLANPVFIDASSSGNFLFMILLL